MKKLIALLIIGSILLGCSSANTNLKNKDEVLIEVGNKKITKGAIYTMLKHQNSAQDIINQARKILLDEKVPVTEAMKQEAAKVYEQYEKLYGNFISYVTQGLSKEEFIEQKLVIIEQEKQFLQPYFDEQYPELFEKDPGAEVKFLKFNKAETAEKALKELTSGKTWQEVKKENLDEKDTQSIEPVFIQTSSTKLVPLPLLQWVMKTNVKEGDIGAEYFADASNENFYIAQVVTKDQAKLKTNFFEHWYNNQDEINKLFAKALKDNGFKVYDEVFVKAIKNDSKLNIYLP